MKIFNYKNDDFNFSNDNISKKIAEILNKIDNSPEENYVDNLITKTRKLICPWTITNHEIPKVKDTTIYINFKTEKKPFVYNTISSGMLNLEWAKFTSYLKTLSENLYYATHKTYDFRINDIPVKIHGNYIQIGSYIIPKFTTIDYFNRFSKTEKINIFLNIEMINNHLSNYYFDIAA